MNKTIIYCLFLVIILLNFSALPCALESGLDERPYVSKQEPRLSRKEQLLLQIRNIDREYLPPLLEAAASDEYIEVTKTILQKKIPYDDSLILNKVIKKRALETFRLFLKDGIECNSPGFWNPLFGAARKHRNPEILKDMLSAALQHGLEIDKQYDDGITPLIALCSTCRDQRYVRIPIRFFLKILLYHGVNTKLKNKNGETAFDIALETGEFHNLAQTLLYAHYHLVNYLTAILNNKGKCRLPPDMNRMIAEQVYKNT